MTKQKTKSAENLGVIRINNGQNAADLVRERDPTGATVVHAVRRNSHYVHERLHATGKLAHELYDAAEKFRLDFERAQLSGNYARLDMFKTHGGRQEVSNGVATAKIRVRKVLDAIGGTRDQPTFSQSCVWNVVGAGLTLDDWTRKIRDSGGAMNADKASGVLHATLERLALHYGMIDVGRIAALSRGRAQDRGVCMVMEFIAVFNATAAPTEKLGMGRLMKELEKRFVHLA